MNKINKLKSDLLKMHTEHMTENREYIMDFEGKLTELGKLLGEAYDQKEGLEQFMAVMDEITKITNQVMGKK